MVLAYSDQLNQSKNKRNVQIPIMAFSKVPSKYQMVSAIVAKMAVLSVAILIFCIRVTLLGLINAEEKKSNFRANEDTFSW